MNNSVEFRVQYQDTYGQWCNTAGAYNEYSLAVAQMVEEATNDPEFDHRIIRIQVLGFMRGGNNINE